MASHCNQNIWGDFGPVFEDREMANKSQFQVTSPRAGHSIQFLLTLRLPHTDWEPNYIGKGPDPPLKPRGTKQSRILAQLFARPISLPSLTAPWRLHWSAKFGPSTQNAARWGYCSISTLLCKNSPTICLSNHWSPMYFATAFSTKHQKEQMVQWDRC